MTDTADFRYLAFLSYSNADRRLARRLHHELEAYRIPKHLLSPVGDPEAASHGLRPIFFDRHELPATSDLPESIGDALRGARFLVVLCSPDAHGSRWVNEEILTFKRLGREDRILSVIVSGVPNARSRGRSDDEECFPPALTGSLDADGNLREAPRVEPLAADLRPEGDGRENAKLKLIAGLLGVGLDALKQRELRAAKARERRSRIITNRLLRSQSRFLASLSWQQSKLGRTDLGIKIALEALPRTVENPDRPFIPSAEDALYHALVEHRFDLDLHESRGEYKRVALSPNGDRAITVNKGESVSLWDLTTGEVLNTFEEVINFIGDIAFSPRGNAYAIATWHLGTQVNMAPVLAADQTCA